MLADKFWKIFMSYMVDALDEELDEFLFGEEENTRERKQYKRKDPFEEFEEKYARYQQYQQKRYEQFYQQYAYGQNNHHSSSTNNKSTQSAEARYYAYLELPPGASFEDIRKAYKKLMKQYHPDRFYQDEKKRQIAEEVCRKLNEAYTYFEKKHKMK